MPHSPSTQELFMQIFIRTALSAALTVGFIARRRMR